MKMILTTFFVASFLSASAFADNPDCEVQKFTACIEVLSNNSINHAHGLFQDVGDLFETCPKLIEGLECVESFKEKCGTEMIAEDFYDQYTKPLLLVKEICQTGSATRTEYLKVSACMLQNSEEFSACSGKVQEFLSSFEADTDEKEKTMACTYEMMFRACILSTAANTCGMDGGNFVRKALQYMPAAGLKLCFEDIPLSRSA